MEDQARQVLQPFIAQDISKSEITPSALTQLAVQLDGADPKENPNAAVAASQLRSLASQLAPKVLERDTALTKAKENYQKLLDDQKAKGTQATAERKTKVEQTVSAIVNNTKSLTFLRPVETKGLSGEKLKQAEQHNAQAKEFSGHIDQLLEKADQPEALAQMAVAAVAAVKLKAELVQSREVASKLHARLKKLSASGSGKSKTQNKGKSRGSEEFESLADALENFGR